jgi:hypothetical protein
MITDVVLFSEAVSDCGKLISLRHNMDDDTEMTIIEM